MENKVFTIHRGKQSLADKLLDAREKLINELKSTEHRLEEVEEIAGVLYINDSKATNLITTKDSIRCLKRPVVWIVNSTAHDRDFMLLNKMVEYKVKSIVVMGENAEDIKRELMPLVDVIIQTQGMKEAIDEAKTLASKGDVILFSPSCPPPPEYNNFVELGNAFKNEIAKIK
ncbi:MAG: hypothetical protein AAF487_01335 [Bacteroidota bacterium]